MLGGRNDDSTARTAGGRSAKTNATPLTFSSHRDELGLNAAAAPIRPPSELRSVTDHDTASVAGSIGASSFGASTFASSKNLSIRELAKEERRRAKRARKELEDALANLPAPQFEYELAVPEDVTMEEADEDERMIMTVKDRADEEAEELERLRKEAERLYEEQSSVMKRGELPRPKGGAVSMRLQGTLLEVSDKGDEEVQLDAATKLIHEEMATLINYDAHSHPILPDKSDPIVAGSLSSDKGSKKDKKRKHQQMDEIPAVSLDYFPEEALDHARGLLEEEYKGVIQEKRELLSSDVGGGVYYEADADVLNAAFAETMRASAESASGVSFSMDKGSSGWNQTDATKQPNSSDTIATLQAEYTALQAATKSLTKSCTKLEQKLHIQTGGYTSRSTSSIDSTLHSFAELQHSRIEQSVYIKLRAHETKGVVLRVERLQEEVEKLEDAEMSKQKRYGELMHDKNRWLLRIKGQGKKQMSSSS